MKIHPDFRDFIHALNNNHVEYVLVGSFALAYHGHPRATGDMDVWIRPTKQNASAVLKAVLDFGFEKVNVTEEDFLSGKIIQLGFPPVRIDIITILDGLQNDEIWGERQKGKFGDLDVAYIGREAFVKNKRAIGRHKDLADLELLGEL